jgi:sentrin-specific protease 8
MNSAENITCLNGNHYLNDSIITYYYLYLEQLLPQLQQLKLINPTLGYMIGKLSRDIVIDHIDITELQEKEYIYIPINDNIDFCNPGGSHWSLLVYHKKENTYHYYDSYGKANLEPALTTAKKFHDYVFDTDYKFVIEQTPQQQNGYDCGVYLLGITECLLVGKSLDTITPELITKMRSDILNMILNKYV